MPRGGCGHGPYAPRMRIAFLGAGGNTQWHLT